ncbi:aminodeoxychorismate/anthranilate synthase component II [soil metagenome]
MILLIDNFDSFTWNLVQAFQVGGADVRVSRNDATDRAAIETLAIGDAELRGIVISPGPGGPSTSGASLDAIEIALERSIPLLGVCLGMQALASSLGAAIIRAPRLVHGAASPISHQGQGLFRGLISPFPAGRYHSLCVDPASLPADLEVTATSADDGVVMGLRHRRLPLEGIQFHPESVLTPLGPRLLAAFLRRCGEGEPERLSRQADLAFRCAAA